LCVCTFADVLVSSSEDSTLRAWNVDTGKELCGYKFSANCLVYDEIRDLLICATNEGFYSIAKVIVSINTKATDIKLLKKVQLSESPLEKLFYPFCK
jgi:WD40 repeat protein